MSYQVLARKWRPRSFDTLVGQEHVVKALTHALEQKRLHHAYLFTGTRGVGKTTIARILAKSLNCETGITATPCGVCSACTEIDAGRFVDLLEVDAATNTKVDEMRQLLENAVYAPTRGRFKVYVIDEVHMLSNAAFNSMLKTLEEPPEHVKFILATTEPQKIPVTVLSRCLQFNLKQMAPSAIIAHLQQIMAKEGIATEPSALRLVAQAANGSMRDALSLLDQAIAYASGEVTEAGVRTMLGTVDSRYLFDLLDALAERNAKRMFEIAGDMESRSIAFDSALIELGTILHRVALAQLAIDVLPEETPERERVVALAQRFDAESVQLHYQISIHARQDLPLAPDEYAGFTMALMRMLAFAPDGGDTTHSAGGQTPQSSVRPIRPAPLQAVKSNAPAVLSRDAAAAPNALRATKASPAKISATTTAATTNAAAMTTTAVTNASTPTASATIVSTPAAAAAKVSAQADWPTLVRSLRMSGVAKQLAERSELLSRDNDKYILRVGADSRSLVQPMYIDKIKAALCEALGRQIRLDVEVGQTSGASVAAIAQNDKRARHEQASNQMNNDPFVRELMNSLDATIESVQPVQQGPQQ